MTVYTHEERKRMMQAEEDAQARRDIRQARRLQPANDPGNETAGVPAAEAARPDEAQKH